LRARWRFSTAQLGQLALEAIIPYFTTGLLVAGLVIAF